MNLNFQQWPWLAGSAALFTMLAATWRQCIGILKRIGDIAICRVVVKDQAAHAVMSLIWDRARRSPFSLRVFGGLNTYVHPVRRVEAIAYENISSDPMLLWIGGRPVVIARPRNGEHEQNIGRSDLDAVVKIWFIRSTFNIDDLVTEAMEHFNKLHRASTGNDRRIKRRFHVNRVGRLDYGQDLESRKSPTPVSAVEGDNILEQWIKTKNVRLLHWNPDDIGIRSEHESAFHGYAFPNSVMEIRREVQTWIENEKWFRSKSVPWRRGWLLHGPPGSGKSTLVRAIAMEFDLPVFALDLNSLDNQSISDAWQKIQQNAPAIALIEDIDAVFHGRENVSAKNTTRDSLTFDCLLNTISGVGNSDGVLLVVTTNHVEHLDDALGVPRNGGSTRPGRIDRVIHLGLMGEPERRLIAHHILSDFNWLIEPTISNGEGDTPAQFQDRCAKIALQKFWEQKA